MGNLANKKAVVLGAAGQDNMGQVIARRLSADGARVLVSGRNEAALSALAEEIGGCYAIADITEKADLDALAESALQQMGGIDIAVNAVGVGMGGPFLDITEDQLRLVTAVQFKGPIQFFQAMIRAMTGGGSIIQISSATSVIMLNDYAAYQGTKAAIDHVVRCVANQFGERGIRVNTVSPGFTDTPMTTGFAATPGVIEAFLPSYPLGRLNTAEDIAAAVAWLATDECFMTGQNLQVNGGLTLRANPTSSAIMDSINRASTKASPD